MMDMYNKTVYPYMNTLGDDSFKTCFSFNDFDFIKQSFLGIIIILTLFIILFLIYNYYLYYKNMLKDDMFIPNFLFFGLYFITQYFILGIYLYQILKMNGFKVQLIQLALCGIPLFCYIIINKKKKKN